MALTSKFRYVLWHYTLSEENLFTLTPDELAIYTLLIQEAIK